MAGAPATRRRLRRVLAIAFACAVLVIIYFAGVVAVLATWAAALSPSDVVLRTFSTGVLHDEGTALSATARVELVLPPAPIEIALRSVWLVLALQGHGDVATASLSDFAVPVITGGQPASLDMRLDVRSSGLTALLNALLGCALPPGCAVAPPRVHATSRVTVDAPLLRPFVTALELTAVVDASALLQALSLSPAAWRHDAASGAPASFAPFASPASFTSAVMAELAPALDSAPLEARAAIIAELRATAQQVGPRAVGFAARPPAWLLDAMPSLRRVPGLAGPEGAAWALRETLSWGLLQPSGVSAGFRLSLLNASVSGPAADAQVVIDTAMLHAPRGPSASWLLSAGRPFPAARAVAAALTALPAFTSGAPSLPAGAAGCLATNRTCAALEALPRSTAALVVDLTAIRSGDPGAPASAVLAYLLEGVHLADLACAGAADAASFHAVRGLLQGLLSGAVDPLERINVTLATRGPRSFFSSALDGVSVTMSLADAHAALLAAGGDGSELAWAIGDADARLTQRSVTAPLAGDLEVAVSECNASTSRPPGACSGSARLLVDDTGAGPPGGVQEPFGGLAASLFNLITGAASAPKVMRLVVEPVDGSTAVPSTDSSEGCAHVGTAELASALHGCPRTGGAGGGDAADDACVASAQSRALAVTAHLEVEQGTTRTVTFADAAAGAPAELPLLLLRHPRTLKLSVGNTSRGAAIVTLPVVAALQACLWRVSPPSSPSGQFSGDLTAGASITYGLRLGLVVVDAAAFWGSGDDAPVSGPASARSLRSLLDVLVNGAAVPATPAPAAQPEGGGGGAASSDLSGLVQGVFAGSRFRVEVATREGAMRLLAAQGGRPAPADDAGRPDPALYSMLDGLAVEASVPSGAAASGAGSEPAAAAVCAAGASSTGIMSAASRARVFDVLPVVVGGTPDAGEATLRPGGGLASLVRGIFAQDSASVTFTQHAGAFTPPTRAEVAMPLEGMLQAWNATGPSNYSRLLSAAAAVLSKWADVCTTSGLAPATNCTWPAPWGLCDAHAAALRDGDASAPSAWAVDASEAGRMAAAAVALQAACMVWQAPSATATWRFAVDVPNFVVQLPAVDVGAVTASVDVRPGPRTSSGSGARAAPAAEVTLDATSTGSLGVSHLVATAQLTFHGALAREATGNSLAVERLVAAVVTGAALDGVELRGAHRGLAFVVPLRRLGLVVGGGARADHVDTLLVSAAMLAQLAAGTMMSSPAATVIAQTPGGAPTVGVGPVPALRQGQPFARLHVFTAPAASGNGSGTPHVGLLLVNVSPGPVNVSAVLGLRLVALLSSTACGVVAVELQVNATAPTTVDALRMSGVAFLRAAASAPVVAEGHSTAGAPVWADAPPGASVSIASTVVRPARRAGLLPPVNAFGEDLSVDDPGGSLGAWGAIAAQLPGAYVAAAAPMPVPLDLIALGTGLTPAIVIAEGLAAGSMAHVSLPLAVTWAGVPPTGTATCDPWVLARDVALALPQLAAAQPVQDGGAGGRPRVVPSCLQRVDGGSGGGDDACTYIHVVSGLFAASVMGQPPALLRFAPPLEGRYHLAPWAGPAAPAPSPSARPLTACSPLPGSSDTSPGAPFVARTWWDAVTSVDVHVSALDSGGVVLAAAVAVILAGALVEACACCVWRSRDAWLGRHVGPSDRRDPAPRPWGCRCCGGRRVLSGMGDREGAKSDPSSPAAGMLPWVALRAAGAAPIDGRPAPSSETKALPSPMAGSSDPGAPAPGPPWAPRAELRPASATPASTNPLTGLRAYRSSHISASLGAAPRQPRVQPSLDCTGRSEVPPPSV